MGADSKFPQRRAFSIVGGELVRIALAYTWYMYCMAGLIELRLSYVWLRQCRFVFRRSSCCIQQVVV